MWREHTWDTCRLADVFRISTFYFESVSKCSHTAAAAELVRLKLTQRSNNWGQKALTDTNGPVSSSATALACHYDHVSGANTNGFIRATRYRRGRGKGRAFTWRACPDWARLTCATRALTCTSRSVHEPGIWIPSASDHVDWWEAILFRQAVDQSGPRQRMYMQGEGEREGDRSAGGADCWSKLKRQVNIYEKAPQLFF